MDRFKQLAEKFNKHFELKLAHAWLFALLALLYIAWVAPLALQSLVLVGAKVWLGALTGYYIDKSMFDFARPDGVEPYTAWMYRRSIIVSACILGLSLGV